jgi:hypothetical protein
MSKQSRLTLVQRIQNMSPEEFRKQLRILARVSEERCVNLPRLPEEVSGYEEQAEEVL